MDTTGPGSLHCYSRGLIASSLRLCVVTMEGTSWDKETNRCTNHPGGTSTQVRRKLELPPCPVSTCGDGRWRAGRVACIGAVTLLEHRVSITEPSPLGAGTHSKTCISKRRALTSKLSSRRVEVVTLSPPQSFFFGNTSFRGPCILTLEMARKPQKRPTRGELFQGSRRLETHQRETTATVCLDPRAEFKLLTVYILAQL